MVPPADAWPLLVIYISQFTEYSIEYSIKSATFKGSGCRVV